MCIHGSACVCDCVCAQKFEGSLCGEKMRLDKVDRGRRCGTRPQSSTIVKPLKEGRGKVISSS